MATPAHTPGPFRIFPRDPEIEGFTVGTAPDELPVAIVPKNRRPNSEAKANAQLFAAGPDMLAALRTAVLHIEHMAAWITAMNGNVPDSRGLYSFEGLGEDLPGIKAALAKARAA